MNKIKSTILVLLLTSANQFVFAEEKALEPESWSFPDVIEHARKISPKNIEGKPFNRFGLVYSSNELASLKLSSMSAKDLQKYADIVTHAYPDAVSKQLPEQCDSLPVAKLNETAVAGIAYVSINAKNPDIRKATQKCLAIIQSNFKKVGR